MSTNAYANAQHVAIRIVRRLVRKVVKPAALLLIEAQLRSSEARESDCITARGMTIAVERDERKRQVELISRRNVIRGW